MREGSFRFRLTPERGRVPATDETILPFAQNPPEPPGQIAAQQHFVSHREKFAPLPQPPSVVNMILN